MSSCDRPGAAPRNQAGAPASGVLRFRPASGPGEGHGWQGVQPAAYKPGADPRCGVLRQTLVGDGGERTAFHVRYFEIAPGGATSLEHHRHEHVVMVLRGRGEVRLGSEVHTVGYGDVVYVAPHEVHQLRNPAADEPFGFLCIVDAQRDAPVSGAGHS